MNKIFFETGDDKTVGTLDLSGPEMVFTGDAEESAKVFMDFVVKQFGDRLKQEREAEREACAKVCDHIYDAYDTEDVDAHTCSDAIRARGDV